VGGEARGGGGGLSEGTSHQVKRFSSLDDQLREGRFATAKNLGITKSADGP